MWDLPPIEASGGPEARPDLDRGEGVQLVEKLLMLVGVFHFPTDYGIDVGELARELEAREFDSLFVCEHTHIPVSRRTPFPGGGELPKRYSHAHDPLLPEARAKT